MEPGAGAHDYSLEESSDDQGGWISWFCDLEGHEFFIEVSLDQLSRLIRTPSSNFSSG